MTNELLHQIGPYQITTELPQRFLLHRYQAQNTQTGERVILHLLPSEFADNSDLADQLLERARAVAQLRHPSIISVLDFGEYTQDNLVSHLSSSQQSAKSDTELPPSHSSGRRFYLVTQPISGQSLNTYLQQRTKRIELNTALAIVERIASALDYAHKQAIVHGYLHPESIYIVAAKEGQPTPTLLPEPKVFINDFYVVAQLSSVINKSMAPDVATRTKSENTDSETSLTTAEQSEGEPANGVSEAHETKPETPPRPCRWLISPYMAPEQARDESTLVPQTDIYTLGAIAYLLLLGRPPFPTGPRERLLTQVANQLATPPETIDPSVSPGVAFVLKSVLAKDASTRYSTATEFVSALQQGSQWVVEPAPLPAPVAPVRSAPSVRRRAKRRWGAWVTAILLLTTAAMIALLLSNNTIRNNVRTQLANIERNLNPQPTPFALVITPTRSGADNGAISTSSALTTTESQRVAGVVITLTVTPSSTPPSTPPSTPSSTRASTPSVTPAATASATATGTVARSTTVVAAGETDSSDRALEIDPLNLLSGTIEAGEIVVNGRAAPETMLRLSIDGRVVSNTEVKSTGTWSLIISVTESGEHELVAQVLDESNSVVAEQTRSITVADTVTDTASGLGTSTTVSTTMTATRLSSTATATATATATRTATLAATPTATRDATSTPRATATDTATATSTGTATATSRPTNTPTETATTKPTSTPSPTRTPRPSRTATATNTPTRTATNTPAVTPTATGTNTPLPTNTPRPTNTATMTNTPQPTATPQPTLTPTRTSTPRPTATATATYTPRPTNTPTNTTVPTATDTPTPTNTPLPTATDTPLPTDTPQPTATDTPLPTSTPLPTNTPRPTNTPQPTNTATPTPTPTVLIGQITPLDPNDGDGGGGTRNFSWRANFTPDPGYGFELVFWKPDENPIVSSFGLAAPTLEQNVTVDLDALDTILGSRLDNGIYQWGVLLVRIEPYERISYLGGGRRFLFNRSSSDDGGGGPPSSGE